MMRARGGDLLLLSLGASTPGVAVALVLLGTTPWPIALKVLAAAGVLLPCLGFTWALHRRCRSDTLATKPADESRPTDEAQAGWQPLLPVLIHEINNSLAPIHSMATMLRSTLEDARATPDAIPREELVHGLGVIQRRADSLHRFISEYARLARLPKPQARSLAIDDAIARAIALETRLAVALTPGPSLAIRADPDQLDQVLINLVRNAADAALETNGGVRAGWSNGGRQVEIWIEDDGPGIDGAADPFAPFYTTKKDGMGIGLALSQQIVEAHGGRIELTNREGTRGCRAVVRLPR